VLQVIVAEGAPGLQGATAARRLAAAGIAALIIPDASVFALMARVNKVLVGARAVLATGGILAQSGTRLVALAAKHHRVPFVVVTGAGARARTCGANLARFAMRSTSQWHISLLCVHAMHPRCPMLAQTAFASAQLTAHPTPNERAGAATQACTSSRRSSRTTRTSCSAPSTRPPPSRPRA
jgi:Initiation factor 2 subunit family